MKPEIRPYYQTLVMLLCRNSKLLLNTVAYLLLPVVIWHELTCLALAAFIGLAAGCAMKHVSEYPSSRVPTAVGASEQNGLRLAVAPMLDRKETERYFGVDALGAGILILHLQAENRSPATTFLLLKENMALIPGAEAQEQAQGAQPIERRSSTGEALGTAGVALMSMPLLYSSVKLLSDASVIQHSFMTKELRDQSLSPGRSASGFLYFKTDPRRRLRGDTLVVKVSETLGGRETEFRIPVNYALHQN